MGTPNRGATRSRLGMEALEDRTVPSTSYAPDRIVVTFADPTNEAANQALLTRPPLATTAERLGFGIYRVDLPAGASVDASAAAFRTMPGVQSVQADTVIQPQTVPNDPSFANQWALQNTGQSGGVAGSDINAAAAWGVTTGTGSTTVAIIDSGVDYTHPDLAANMWRNPDEIAGNGKDDDGDGFADNVYGVNFVSNTGDPMDTDGHGTHIAGIIGAVGNNGVGLSGVNWKVKIMALKFMNSVSGGFMSDAIRAMDFAVANGAKVISNSWGSGQSDAALSAAIGRARNAGVIVVCAAGNNSADTTTTPFYPANYTANWDNMVTVAATTTSDTLASFSNYGQSTITLAAPGVNIVSTLPGNQYGLKSGTSMATPFVTGAIALLWDLHPTWTYRQIINKLQQSVDYLPSLQGKVATGGRLDLAKLVDAPSAVVPPTVPPVTTSPPVTTTTTGPKVVAATFGGPRNGVIDRVWVQFDRVINPATLSLAGSILLDGPNGGFNVSAVSAVTGTNNTQFTFMFSGNQTTTGVYTAIFGTPIRDTLGNPMNQDGNSISGETTDRYVLTQALSSTGVTVVAPVSPPSPPVSPPPPASPPAVVTPDSARRTVTSTNTQQILDRRTTRVDFTVTDTTTISDLKLTLNITHARTYDLSIRLVAPDGRSVTLFNRRSGVNLTGVTFEDSSSRTLSSVTSGFTGSFKPEQALSLFNGMSARGVWSLQIFDLADGVTGSITSASLSFALPSGVSVAGTSLAPVTSADLRGSTAQTSTTVLTGRGDTIVNRS